MTTPTPIYVDLPAIASRLLDLATNALTPTPTRSYRSIGPPAWPLGESCDQLAVWVGPMQPGQPGEMRPNQYEVSPNRLRAYTIVVEIARCFNADDPTPAELDAAAAGHFADFQALDEMIKGLGFSGKVHDDGLKAVGVKAVASGTIQTVSPSGGMAAVRAQAMVTV